jgi:hypothetical protein
MSRNVTITFAVAIALGLYFLGGIVTQLIAGLLPSSDAVMALGVSVLATVLLPGIVYLVLWFGGKKIGLPDRPMPLGTVGKSVTAVLAVAALAGGVSTSMDRVQEANASKAQATKVAENVKAAREAEAQRLAALTPVQRAAEIAQRETAAKQAAAKAAEAKAAEDAKKAAIAAKDEAVKLARARALLGAQALKKSMKDPDTFELKEVLFMDDGTACYTYRAKNSFNAMLRGQAVLTSNVKNIELLVEGHNGNKFANAWNKGCAKKSGEDITSLVNRMLG